MVSGIAKQCLICKHDVTDKRRVRDSGGNYYCEPCYSRISAESNSATPPGTSAQAGSVEPPPPQHNPIVQRLARSRWGLAESAVCPHCWHGFAPENLLWVSQHAELLGDLVLGPAAPLRFLSSRFTPQGHAIDARGMPCQVMACPRCHLTIPRSVIESEPLFVSIIGVPSSGKSYLLTSMIWQLRQALPARFQLSFVDADTESNRSLNEYEETLFLSPDPDAIVAIRKTETEGELYDQVRLGEQMLNLPRPFLFTMKPLPGHPNHASAAKTSRTICLYDNAGEHFLPGSDTVSSPVTQHMAKSRVLMFLYDPMQDPRFRQRCADVSSDPQLGRNSPTSRQETVLTEAAHRVRKYTGLAPGKKHKSPLVVIVPKHDVWAHLLPDSLDTDPYRETGTNGMCAVDVQRIEATSAQLRSLLLALVPELVTAAEDFCELVMYVPVSATGCSPEADETGRRFGVRPRNLKPRWAAVPFMYMFAKWSTGLIATAKASNDK